MLCNSPLQLMLLCKKLDAIWKENEGMEVLFLWTQFLKEDTLKFLKVNTFMFILCEKCGKQKISWSRIRKIGANSVFKTFMSAKTKVRISRLERCSPYQSTHSFHMRSLDLRKHSILIEVRIQSYSDYSDNSFFKLIGNYSVKSVLCR